MLASGGQTGGLAPLQSDGKLASVLGGLGIRVGGDCVCLGSVYGWHCVYHTFRHGHNLFPSGMCRLVESLH